jgi:membrane protease YdiL (CAAX protease family)
MDTINSKQNNTLLIGGIFIAFLFYPVLGHQIFLGFKITETTFLYSRLFFWLWVFILYFYAHKVEHSDFLLWKDKPYKFSYYVASVIILYLLCIACGIVSVIPKVLGWHEHNELIIAIKSLLSKNMPLLIFSAITAGITEELIFRGYLVPRLELLFKNKFMPVIISAFMFAVMHYKYRSMSELIFTFAFGILFATHYQKYRNIKILMITHAAVDLISFFLYRELQPHLH